MKKYFKTYTKKSLALLMTVMMLMSCWVFVAPEHNHASAVSAATVATTNNAAINGLVINTDVTTVRGSFEKDNNNLEDKDYNAVYHNVLYTDGTVYGARDKAAAISDKTQYGSSLTGSNGVTIYWYHPSATLFYDGGSDLPRLGVAMNTVMYYTGMWSRKSVNRSSWLSSGLNGFAFNENWRGDDKQINFQWMWNAKGGVMTYTYKGTDPYHTQSGDNDDHFYANLLKFTGTMGDNEYYRDGTPRFGFFGDNGSDNKEIYATSTKKIAIINYVPLKNALTSAATMLADIKAYPNKYTTDSVAKFAELAKALVAAKPNNYVNSSKNDYTGYAAAAKAAVDAWNAWVNAGGLQLATYTVTFKASNDLFTNTESVAYGGSVIYVCNEVVGNASGHYRFEKWYEGDINTTLSTDTTITLTNITDDRTIIAKYGDVENHNSAGGYEKPDDTHHRTRCSVCGYVSDAVSCTFSGDFTQAGNNHERSCVCGNKQSHAIKWVNKIDSLYQQQAVDCTHDGIYYKSCETCGLQGTETFKAYTQTGHNYQYLKTERPKSCTENALVIYACLNCSDEIKSEYIVNPDGEITETLYQPAGHRYIQIRDEQHSCTEDGYIKYQCLDCKHEYKDYKKDDPAAHTWATYLSKIDDTYHGYICTVCKKEYDGEAPHKWTLDSTITAQTCTKAGQGSYKCNDCGATKIDTIPADSKSHVLDNPTQNEDGKTHTAHCKDCGYSETAADCTNDSTCKCLVCGGSLAHNFTATTVKADALKSEATCTYAAEYYYSCSVCGTVNKDDAKTFTGGAALGHDWTDTTTFEKTAATCEVGTIYYKECSRCHKSSKDLASTETWTDNDALGHDFTGDAVKGDGSHSYECKNDGCNATGVGNVKGATEDCTYGTTYTINTDGTHTQKCTVCEDEKAEKHSYSAWSHMTEKDTEGKDQHKKTCICGDVVIEKCNLETTHVDATCQDHGYIGYKCDGCGYETLDDDPDAPKKDHAYSGDYVYDATTDTHKQRCVNGCNGLPDGAGTACTYKYTQISGTNTHKAQCTICQGEKTLNCNGGSATCIEKATCKDCDGKYGNFAAHNFTGEFVNAGEGKHYRRCATEGCTECGLDSVVNKTAKCHGGTAYCEEKAICSDCGTSYGEFNANNHKKDSLEAQAGLAPTCMQPGYTSYKKCKDCGAETGKIALGIDSKNHNFGGTAISNDDQTHKLVCQNMNAEGTAQCTATTNAPCHSTNSTVKPATCLEGGYQINTCDDCSHVWYSDNTDPLGHDWGSWTYNETTGKHERACNRDDSHTEEGLCADSEQTVTTIAPTCTEGGYDRHVCNDCGHEWRTNPTNPTGHTYTEKIIDEEHIYDGVTESCTSAKHYWYDCEDCDKNAKDEDDHDKYPLNELYYQNGPSKGHKWSGKVATSENAIIKTEATCTTNAIYYVYCTNCGMSSHNVDPTDENYDITFEAFGSATDHKYIEKAEEQYLCSVATCSAQAVYYKSCENCGKKSNDTFKFGEMADHNFTQKIPDTAHRITKATCMTKATYWFDCANCDLSAEIYAKNNGLEDAQIAVLQFNDGEKNNENHTALVDVSVKNPTCLEAGYSAHKKCNDCGTVIGKTVYNQLSHSYTGAYKTANVEVDGVVTAYKHQRLCVNGCGDYSTETACTFSEFKQDVGGTTHSKSCVCGNKITEACVSSGTASCTEVATCVTCGGTMGVAGNHSLPETWTSSDDGKTHYRVCGNEGCNYKETQKCSGGVANTCGGIYCSTCGQQYGTGTHHDWTDWAPYEEATCTKRPTQKRTCKRDGCLEYEIEEYGSPKDHTWNSGEETIPATCTTDGVKTFKCAVTGCDGIKTVPLASLGHDLTDWETTTEPKCDSEGERSRHCKNSWKTADGKIVNCDYVDAETLPADPTKHVEADEYVLASGTGTCSTGLIYELKCKNCGTVLDTKTKTIPHKWEEVTVHNGTCTENGTIDMKCGNCGATAVFNDKCEGYPNNFEGTVINSTSAALLPSKGGHAWRKTALENDEKYTVLDGVIIYIDIDFSCSYTGKGHKVCEACGKSESIIIPKAVHDIKIIPASPATCQTPGYHEYKVCKNCPYAETPVKIPALGHEDNNGNGKCDRCGFEMYETPSGGSSACGCICHNSSFFISKIIYPIVRFFWKLFKMNPDCSCGKRHY